MANTDAPFGLRFVTNKYTGSSPPVRQYPADATTTVYRGQLVEIGSGVVYRIADGAYTAGMVVGVAMGSHDGTGSGLVNIPIVSAAGSRFAIQANDAFSGSSVAPVTSEATFWAMAGYDEYFHITGNTTETFTGSGRSEAELNGAGAHATQGVFRVVDYENVAGHAWGAFMMAIVEINPTAMAKGPEQVMSG
ncbi:MAG: hypothetical protein GY838_13635 [bacterium]|nr:hypothetical protein [bacterium]